MSHPACEVVDLTGDHFESDLQRAIAESLASSFPDQHCWGRTRGSHAAAPPSGPSFQSDLEAALAASLQTLAQDQQLRQSGASCSGYTQRGDAAAARHAASPASAPSGSATGSPSPSPPPGRPHGGAMHALCAAAAVGKRAAAVEGLGESGGHAVGVKRSRRGGAATAAAAAGEETPLHLQQRRRPRQREEDSCSEPDEGGRGEGISQDGTEASSGGGGSCSSHLPARSCSSQEPIATSISCAELACAQQRRQQHAAATAGAPLPRGDGPGAPAAGAGSAPAAGAASASVPEAPADACAARVFYPGQAVFHQPRAGGPRSPAKVLRVEPGGWQQRVYTIELAGGAGYADAWASCLRPRPLPGELWWVRAGGDAGGGAELPGGATAAASTGAASDGGGGGGGAAAGAAAAGSPWRQGRVVQVVDEASWPEPVALVEVGWDSRCWPVSGMVARSEPGESSATAERCAGALPACDAALPLASAAVLSLPAAPPTSPVVRGAVGGAGEKGGLLRLEQLAHAAVLTAGDARATAELAGSCGLLVDAEGRAGTDPVAAATEQQRQQQHQEGAVGAGDAEP